MKPKGVLSVDDTLLSHYGRCFDQIAWLFDPALRCHRWAHNLVGLHYSDDETDYPVSFCLWRPADLERIETGLRAAGITIKPSKEALKEQDPKKWRLYLLGLWRRKQHQAEVKHLYKSKLTLAEDLLRRFVATHPEAPEAKLPVVFDSWRRAAGLLPHRGQRTRAGLRRGPGTRRCASVGWGRARGR